MNFQLINNSPNNTNGVKAPEIPKPTTPVTRTPTADSAAVVPDLAEDAAMRAALAIQSANLDQVPEEKKEEVDPTGGKGPLARPEEIHRFKPVTSLSKKEKTPEIKDKDLATLSKKKLPERLAIILQDIWKIFFKPE